MKSSDLLATERKWNQTAKLHLLNIAASYFNDSTVWPLHITQYYLGHVPKLDAMSLPAPEWKRAHDSFHLAGIQLAGRIYGDYIRTLASHRDV